MTSNAGEQASKRFAHIDFMRAIAVLLVLLQHAGLERSLLGSAGVTMFFVISGFVITNLALAEAKATGRFGVGDFYLRRAIKLLPPLFAIVLLPSVLIGTWSKWEAVSPTALLSQLLFFYNSVRIHGQQGVLPGTDVLWSLSVEEQFYIGFALLWFLCLKLPRPTLALTWLAAVAVVWANLLRVLLASEYRLDLAPRIYFSTETRIDAIALGVLAAILIRTQRWQVVRRRLTDLIWDGILFTGATLLFFSVLLGHYAANYSWLISVHAVASAMLLLAGFSGSSGLLNRGFLKAAELPLARVIGLASFSIYLVHHTISLALGPVLTGFPPLVGVAAKVLAGVSVGVLAWLAVERPIERLKSRTMPRKWRAEATVG